MGPAVTQDQLETDLDYIKIGQDEGAQAGGGRQPPLGSMAASFMQPAVFDGVQPGMRLAQEEIFGPVIGILRAQNFEEAIERANAIALACRPPWSRATEPCAFTFAEPVQAGVVKVNEPTTGLALAGALRRVQALQRQHLQRAGPGRDRVLHAHQDDLRGVSGVRKSTSRVFACENTGCGFLEHSVFRFHRDINFYLLRAIRANRGIELEVDGGGVDFKA
jgi:hypothetical protein